MKKRYSGPGGVISFEDEDGNHAIQTGRWWIEDVNMNPDGPPDWRGDTKISAGGPFGRFWNWWASQDSEVRLSMRGDQPSEDVSGLGVVLDLPMHSDGEDVLVDFAVNEFEPRASR